jgi:hypothetical protein
VMSDPGYLRGFGEDALCDQADVTLFDLKNADSLGRNKHGGCDDGVYILSVHEA